LGIVCHAFKIVFALGEFIWHVLSGMRIKGEVGIENKRSLNKRKLKL
jgi:hypothetical protein